MISVQLLRSREEIEAGIQVLSRLVTGNWPLSQRRSSLDLVDRRHRVPRHTSASEALFARRVNICQNQRAYRVASALHVQSRATFWQLSFLLALAAA